MVPLATELVVGHDDQGVFGLRARCDLLEQVDEVVAAVRLTGVARVLVLRAVRLDEADRREGAGGAAAMKSVSSWRWARPGCARGVVREVVERLVVVLEQRAGVAGLRVRPAAGVPGPRDALRAVSRSPMFGYVASSISGILHRCRAAGWPAGWC